MRSGFRGMSSSPGARREGRAGVMEKSLNRRRAGQCNSDATNCLRMKDMQAGGDEGEAATGSRFRPDMKTPAQGGRRKECARCVALSGGLARRRYGSVGARSGGRRRSVAGVRDSLMGEPTPR